MTSLTLVRRVAAQPETVFAALTEPAAITCWWGPDAGPTLLAETDVRVGGSYRVRFRKEDGTEHEASGHYLEVVRPSRLVMTWRWAEGGYPDEAGRESRIEIELRPIDMGTEIVFTHARLHTEASRDAHTWGWTGAFDKLEEHLRRPQPGRSCDAG
jgi:uncharacterized protein YndB with AHSA1/START domain